MKMPEKVSPVINAAAGTGTSTVTAATSVVQPNAEYRNMLQAFQSILKHEGIYGFYKGLWVTLVKTVPSNALTFLAFEATLQVLQFMRGGVSANPAPVSAASKSVFSSTTNC
jgi:hypothetical protein